MNLCRFVLGCTFVFSGFVKAIDPIGFFYKIQDYLMAFGLVSLLPDFVPLLFAVGLSAIEFCMGVFLVFGVRRGLASWVLLLLMCVMTPLTLYVAIANPVADCGCFGEALVLTNWQTFGKNVVLLAMAVLVFKKRQLMFRFITSKSAWMVSMYTLLFIFALSAYCLLHLPIFDFLPFRVGVNIEEAMGVPEGKELDEYETIYVMEKDGKRQEFDMYHYPDSTWTKVEVRNVVVKKGYQPPIKDFALTDMQTGEDIGPQVLADQGYTFLLVAPRLERADDSNIDLINEMYDYSVEHGYRFCAVTASSPKEVERWCDRTGAEYPFYKLDETTLKGIIRSNPGMLLLKGGTILNKWSDNQLPDEYVLTGALEQLPLGQQRPVNNVHTLLYVCLWFFIPLMLALGIDILIVKRRMRNAHTG